MAAENQITDTNHSLTASGGEAQSLNEDIQSDAPGAAKPATIDQNGAQAPAPPAPGLSDAPADSRAGAAPKADDFQRPGPPTDFQPGGSTAEGSQLTSLVGLPSAPPQDMSIKDMFLGADPVVQGVMLLLLLASIATWVVIFEKAIVLRRAAREIERFKKISSRRDTAISTADYPHFSQSMVEAGIIESCDTRGKETRSDFRERIERSMRAELAGLMDRLGRRTALLASVGSVSPFVGLFGTVWGIMHSFIGIASSGETTLAVVAPGIAEALFATAMGLVAAIPAVIAYNKITGTLKKITKEALSGIGFAGNILAGRRFGGIEAVI